MGPNSDLIENQRTGQLPATAVSSKYKLDRAEMQLDTYRIS